MVGVLPPILGGLQLSASQFIDKLSEVRDVLGETAGSTDDLDLAQARAEATSSQLADAQERLSAANADLIATQDAINEGMLQGSEASTAQSAALERQTVAEGEVRDATLANSEAQGKLAESEVAAADTGVLQDERLIKVGKLVTYAFLGIGAAVVGISVKMAMSFQSSQAKVQAALGQSVKQSNALANSLLGTAGHTEQSASAMEAALAPVAAQFKSLQGGAYTTADALEEMKAASTLADAGLGSLSDTTGDLAGIMQAFQLRAKDAASTADILYSASQLTGQGIDSLTSGLERTRTKLGALAPSLGDLSGLLADMTEHGETGRAAMSMLTTTMTALLKPTAAAAKAQTDLKATLDAMPPSLRALADEYQSGALTGNSLTAATDGMSTANAALWKAFVSAAGGARTSNLASKELGLTVLNNKGQFVGMASVIGQLQEKLKGLTNAQATAELTALGFGSSSAKLLALVRAGPEAFDKATAAVTKHGRAENAANLQMKTLHGQLHETVDHHHHVEREDLSVRGMQQRDVEQHYAVGALMCTASLDHDDGDGRMSDRVQRGDLLGIREDQRCKSLAVQRRVRRQDPASEPVDQRLVGRSARLHYFARNAVGIDQKCTVLDHEARNRRLARTDPTRQRHGEHVLRTFHGTPTRLLGAADRPLRTAPASCHRPCR